MAALAERPAATTIPKKATQGTSVLSRLLRQRFAVVGLLLVFLFAALAVFAPLLTSQDPATIRLADRLAAPSLLHLFGTDELGRDIYTRILYGGRISLGVAIAVVASSLSVGVALGAIAGFYRGWLDVVINIYLSNAFLALPGILLAVAIVAFLGPSLPNLVLALALPAWVGYARLVRAQVLALREREFVQAARSLGASDARLLLRSILPHTLGPILVQAAIGMATAVLSEATLSFLGLGVQPPIATWGAMLNAARSHLFEAPHLVFFPALAVALCVLAFNLVGDGLRDALDPRQTEVR